MAEQLLCKQWVAGSSPATGSERAGGGVVNRKGL